MQRLGLLLMLLMITSRFALAFDTKIDTIVVNYDTCQVQQIIVTIYNSNSETLWIWYDHKDYGKDYRKAIKYYLMKRKGDFSIFDIGTDPNMVGEWWRPSATKDCFIKCLEPCKSFSMILYKEITPSLDNSDYNFVISGIKIFSNQQIKETCPGIVEPYSVKRISYPYDIIALPINL